eukprot:CAMPEP_0170529520 /NCGR_PEP_ID=MMETSP0209-20121228/24516_1 /TAXON_ID=665100 ORGANISM="Litonotus pictus, Strain P1" /NCGR_SAMPLE_ID=MMETSP0209 /ASSEMBLY_ACC=CAM_ASM_000301 /LENGTH=454 /DNA_ID=CAMNT_0010821577 /DNA_START=61 /DNA_END=1425 /DNA_ORIENTATION=-
MTVDQLKVRLNKMGLPVDNGKRAKKVYIDMILNAAESAKKQKDQFQAPLNFPKGIGNKIKDVTMDSTKNEAGSYYSENSNVYPNQYLSNGTGNSKQGTPFREYNGNMTDNNYMNNSNNNLEMMNDGKVRTQKLMLHHKRMVDDTSNSKSFKNNYDPMNTRTSFNSGYRNSQNQRSEVRGSSNNKVVNVSQPNTDPRKYSQVSSKSLKALNTNNIHGNLNSTEQHRKEVNDAFYNCRIDLNEGKVNISGVKPFSKTPSQISTISTRRRRNRQSHFILLRPMTDINGHVDYIELLKLIGGSLAAYAAIYYLFKHRDDSSINLQNLTSFLTTNSDIIIKGTTVVLIVTLVWLIYNYHIQKNEYNYYCETLAKKCYQHTVEYFEEKGLENTQHHMNEEELIENLARTFEFSTDKFKREVYDPHLEYMLSMDRRFSMKDLVEDGEIKAFWIFTASNNSY